LPIRSCIEAFLNGDDTALQFTVGPSSAELQQVLASISWTAASSNADTADSEAACTAPEAASLPGPVTSADSTAGQPSAVESGGCSIFRVDDAKIEAKHSETQQEVALKPPLTAPATRTKMQLDSHALTGSATRQESTGNIDSGAETDVDQQEVSAHDSEGVFGGTTANIASRMYRLLLHHHGWHTL